MALFLGMRFIYLAKALQGKIVMEKIVETLILRGNNKVQELRTLRT